MPQKLNEDERGIIVSYGVPQQESPETDRTVSGSRETLLIRRLRDRSANKFLQTDIMTGAISRQKRTGLALRAYAAR